MDWIRIFLVTNFILFSSQEQNPPEYDHGLGISTSRPLNIAHRGSSGVFPEHTSVSYIHAIQHGADMIEVDIAVTKDLHLVCLHESWLSTTTNAEDVFPEERKNTYNVYGVPITDFFSVDFTLEELKQLKMKQRYNYRDHNLNNDLKITTFEEFIQIVQAYNKTVVLLPELKSAAWFNSLDILQNADTTMEELIVGLLNDYGYYDNTDSVLVESFEEDSIRRVSEISELAVSFVTSGTLSDERLQELSQFCYGVVIEKGNIVEVNSQGQRIRVSDFVERARSVGLKVYAYTMRNEDQFLIWDYEQDPVLEYEDFVMNALVDGIMTDFPHTFNRYLEVLYSGYPSKE